MLSRLKFLLGARLVGRLAARAEDPAAALDFAYEKQSSSSGRCAPASRRWRRRATSSSCRPAGSKASSSGSRRRPGRRSPPATRMQARRALELKLGVQQQLRDLDPQLALLHDRQQQLTRQQQQLAEAARALPRREGGAEGAQRAASRSSRSARRPPGLTPTSPRRTSPCGARTSRPPQTRGAGGGDRRARRLRRLSPTRLPVSALGDRAGRPLAPSSTSSCELERSAASSAPATRRSTRQSATHARARPGRARVLTQR